MSTVKIVDGTTVNIDVVDGKASGISVASVPSTNISMSGVLGGKDAHFVFTQSIP